MSRFRLGCSQRSIRNYPKFAGKVLGVITEDASTEIDGGRYFHMMADLSHLLIQRIHGGKRAKKNQN
jgi:hypothetical protein